MATFHTDEGFFSPASPVSQAGQGETAAAHAMPPLTQTWPDSLNTALTVKGYLV